MNARKWKLMNERYQMFMIQDDRGVTIPNVRVFTAPQLMDIYERICVDTDFIIYANYDFIIKDTKNNKIISKDDFMSMCKQIIIDKRDWVSDKN